MAYTRSQNMHINFDIAFVRPLSNVFWQSFDVHYSLMTSMCTPSRGVKSWEGSLTQYEIKEFESFVSHLFCKQVNLIQYD